MIHCILFSQRRDSDDIVLPHWEPLLTTEDEQRAASYFRRIVKCDKGHCALWVTVTHDGLIGVVGYVDWHGAIDHTNPVRLPTEISCAAEEIARMVAGHHAVDSVRPFAPYSRKG